MKSLLILSLMLFSQISLADLVNPELVQDSEETVIDPSFTEDITWEEPAFASRPSKRDIASFDAIEIPEPSEDDQLQGQLAVQKEIPYSYPDTSFRYWEQRTLREYEAEQKKKKTQ